MTAGISILAAICSQVRRALIQRAKRFSDNLVRSSQQVLCTSKAHNVLGTGQGLSIGCARKAQQHRPIPNLNTPCLTHTYPSSKVTKRRHPPQLNKPYPNETFIIIRIVTEFHQRIKATLLVSLGPHFKDKDNLFRTIIPYHIKVGIRAGMA